VDIKNDFGYKKISACKLDLREGEINMTKVYAYNMTCNFLFISFREEVKDLLLNVLQQE
jgi:hypothetical protein